MSALTRGFPGRVGPLDDMAGAVPRAPASGSEAGTGRELPLPCGAHTPDHDRPGSHFPVPGDRPGYCRVVEPRAAEYLLAVVEHGGVTRAA
ncbi:hypothetical protein GCM10023215_19530 [Pseudonocardia yuanmonensis]|uniref:Uncharacterized protein n=1 Tax=Pseudonocardia yuanmonensis TaxID=1095914 RepID=A0ABP8WAC4_9PSEU